MLLKALKNTAKTKQNKNKSQSQKSIPSASANQPRRPPRQANRFVLFLKQEKSSHRQRLKAFHTPRSHTFPSTRFKYLNPPTPSSFLLNNYNYNYNYNKKNFQTHFSCSHSGISSNTFILLFQFPPLSHSCYGNYLVPIS